MAIATNRKLILKDVADNFRDYNFIIYTNFGVIDTTKYQKATYGTSSEGTAFTTSNSNNDGRLMLVTGTNKSDNIPYGQLKSTANIYGSGQQACEYVDEANTIYIFQHEVQYILIKSKRDFLKNQKPVR